MSTDCLDRIEAILAENALQLVEPNTVGFREPRQITDSNARTIEGASCTVITVFCCTQEADTDP